jgi:hypothetical protein
MIDTKTIIEFLRFAGFARMEWDENEMTCYYPGDEQPFGAAEFTGETWDRWTRIELAMNGSPPYQLSLKEFPYS